MSSLFVPGARDTWVPTDLARGPWDPDALHGGPVATLFARAVEPLLADFGNGISGLDLMNDLLFINPDLTIQLSRLPVGEWVCLDARSRYEPDGIGSAVSDLYDEAGPIGRSTQSLLLDSR